MNHNTATEYISFLVMYAAIRGSEITGQMQNLLRDCYENFKTVPGLLMTLLSMDTALLLTILKWGKISSPWDVWAITRLLNRNIDPTVRMKFELNSDPERLNEFRDLAYGYMEKWKKLGSLNDLNLRLMAERYGIETVISVLNNLKSYTVQHSLSDVLDLVENWKTEYESHPTEWILALVTNGEKDANIVEEVMW